MSLEIKQRRIEMLKLKLLAFDEQGNLISTTDCGNFRSYKDIGKRLFHKGKPGRYYAIPNNMTSLSAIKEITVTQDKFGKQVEMEGGLY